MKWGISLFSRTAMRSDGLMLHQRRFRLDIRRRFFSIRAVMQCRGHHPQWHPQNTEMWHWGTQAVCTEGWARGFQRAFLLF